MYRHTVLVCLLAALTAPVNSFAGALKEAKVTKIVNEVKLIDPAAGNRDAHLDDVVRENLALTTGIKSRSELLFQDDTLTRLGPESYFSFKSDGSRDMTLEKGTMLLQVPKGIGGAKIHTAAVTAAITGTTVMVEHLPKKTLKMLVLEGSMRVSINGQFGDSLLLTPGKMVIMRPDAKRIPDPVTVDLKKLVKTSTLVNMHGGKKGKDKPLPSMALIDQEINQQQIAKDSHHLIDTNLIILGKGTNVLLGSADLMRYLDNRTDVVKTEASPAPGTPSSTPIPTPVPIPTPPVADVGASPTIKLSGDKKNLRTDVRYGDKQALTSPLVLNKNQDYSKNGGSGSIKINSKDSVTVNSMLKVSGATSDKGHGEISIQSAKTNGTAITVSSSAQLLALLSATSHDKGNKITFQSAGGAIDVGGQLQADQGTIDIRNNGLNGNVALNNATLSASTIKVGALGNNGTLTIGGGSMSADNMIKLYAGGSNGTVIFVDDVTLNGKSLKTIAGDTVTIIDGKVVTVHGPAPVSVFTNHPNYTGWGGNGSTTGTFAGNGAITLPLSGKPGF